MSSQQQHNCWDSRKKISAIGGLLVVAGCTEPCLSEQKVTIEGAAGGFPGTAAIQPRSDALLVDVRRQSRSPFAVWIDPNREFSFAVDEVWADSVLVKQGKAIVIYNWWHEAQQFALSFNVCL